MLRVFPGVDRFHTHIGWLDSRHTFSFGEHFDERRLGFRNLRVINDDRVSAGAGFGTHGHKDMEIVSYVVDGTLGHKDSMGTNGTIVPGEIQRMSAGTGVSHSEMNHQQNAPVHFLQIWILPRSKSTKPAYAQKAFAPSLKKNALCRLVFIWSCSRAHQNLLKPRTERLKVSGNPAQYDNLDIFIEEQELMRRLVRESMLPVLELDMSNNTVETATEHIADWMESTGGLYMST